MCGIAGIMAGPRAPAVSLEELRRMVAMLGHRGPDGHGLYRGGGVGLAHTRLSLVDLAGSPQPMGSADGRLWLTFNGEIFNYVELRRQLGELGHRFRSNGDTEVILHCYQHWGEQAWSRLNGQFAFALWDAARRRLWLVRDRMGIVPLHYARLADSLVFASEAKALFAGGRLAPRIDPAGLAEAFICWSAMAPRTVFRQVSLVPPGTALCFDAALGCRESRYWQPRPGALPALSAEEAAEALEAHLEQAVSLRLRADVPVGAYVSGGLDSSVIGSLARERAGGRLETFGIRFADPRFDETAEQQRMVRVLGSRHHEILVEGADIRAALEEVVWHCETPLLRTSPVPMFLLSGLVRQAGIRTVLTGEGADELLAGYSIFKEDQIRRFWARQPESALRPALLSRLHHYVGDGAARATPFWRSFFGKGLGDTGHPFYSHLIRWHNTAWTLRLLAPEIAGAASPETVMAERAARLPEDWRDWDPLLRAQVTEMDGFMSSYLLSSQGDRVAMAHAVEARYPFLDPDLVDFCLALPKRHKLLGTRDKLALRRLAARRLPPEIWRRRKQPFRAPIGPALFGRAAMDGFGELLSEEGLRRSGLFETETAGRLLRRARGLDGHLGGEREEMGLVGVLTASLLARHFGPAFAPRAAEARARLDRLPLHVCVDQGAGPDCGPDAVPSDAVPPDSILAAGE